MPPPEKQTPSGRRRWAAAIAAASVSSASPLGTFTTGGFGSTGRPASNLSTFSRRLDSSPISSVRTTPNALASSGLSDFPSQGFVTLANGFFRSKGTLWHHVERQFPAGAGIRAGQALDTRIRRLHVGCEAMDHGFVEAVEGKWPEITNRYGPAEPAGGRSAVPRGTLYKTARPSVAIHNLIELEPQAIRNVRGGGHQI